MKVTQINTVLNDVAKQVFGDKAVTVVDVAGMISLGDMVFSSDKNKDNFLDTLVDKITKTIMSARAYDIEDNSGILKDSFEFGAILQKTYVDTMEAVESKTWGLVEGGTVDSYQIFKPKVKQKLFSDIGTWEVPITIPDVQFKSAFTNAEQMAIFIDTIFVAVRNSMKVHVENTRNLTVANFIAEKVKNNVGKGAINLIQTYFNDTGVTITVDKALKDTDFLKYATQQINLYTKRLTKMSTLFNDEEYKRFTPKQFLSVKILEDFASAQVSYLQSDTYHKELVSLPGYTSVLYWQGTGTDYAFSQTATIKLKTASGTDETVTGVIALLHDRDAMGVTIDNQRSKSAYSERGEYTTFYEKADIGHYNDMSENGIVFYIENLA